MSSRTLPGWLLGLLAVALWTGCSWIFDDSAPELPLVGERPVMERFLKLNVMTFPSLQKNRIFPS